MLFRWSLTSINGDFDGIMKTLSIIIKEHLRGHDVEHEREDGIISAHFILAFHLNVEAIDHDGCVLKSRWVGHFEVMEHGQVCLSFSLVNGVGAVKVDVHVFDLDKWGVSGLHGRVVGLWVRVVTFTSSCERVVELSVDVISATAFLHNSVLNGTQPVWFVIKSKNLSFPLMVETLPDHMVASCVSERAGEHQCC